MDNLNILYYLLCAYYLTLIVDFCLERARSDINKINMEVTE